MGMPLKTKAILAVAALAFIAMLVIFSEEPSLPDARGTCSSMGIDPQAMKEGTCYVGNSKTVVVDRGHRLKLETLDARLLGIRQGTTLSGPGGTRGAKGVFLTFDLAITNRTDAPVRVGPNQFALLIQGTYGEDVEAEREYEPHSFLAQRKPLPPGGTVRGTVVFQVPQNAPTVMREHGNLDLANFGPGGSDYEPEAVLDGAEVGVIRTYLKPSSG